MNNAVLKLFVFVQNLLAEDQGQDLVEYALLVSLIALAAISAVGSIAGAITNIFTNVSNSLA